MVGRLISAGVPHVNGKTKVQDEMDALDDSARMGMDEYEEMLLALTLVHLRPPDE